MPVPPKRHSKGKTRRRRSHHALTRTVVSTCVKCGASIKPHYACPSCGYYRGRDVLKKAVRAERTVAKKVATKPRAAKAPKKATGKTETKVK